MADITSFPIKTIVVNPLDVLNAAAAAAGSATTATTKAAEAAASAAAADVYSTTSAGLAAVTVGGQFSVISGVDLVRYRVDAGPVATEVLRMSLNNASTLVPVLPSDQTAPYSPNFDRATQILTIYSRSVIFFGTALQVYSVPETVNIDTTNGGVLTTSARNVYFRTTDNSFVVRAWNTVMNYADALNHHLIAVVRHVTSVPSATRVVMSSFCTVDGVSQINAARESYTDWAAIYTPLFVVAPDRSYPNYDGVANTLTFFRDTILQHGDIEWALTSDTTVSMTASSANRVWWDKRTNVLVCRGWSSANLTEAERMNFVLVASIRDPDVVPGNTAVISMMCPYTVNGRIYGLIATSGVIVAENPVGASLEGIHHRGYSAVAPENTLAAYKASANVRNYTVEGDIRWTSDDVAVLLHNSTIDATSNGTGGIAGMTLATAKTYDFGSWKGADFAGEKIPTWDEYLTLAKKLGLYGYFEIKTDATLTQVQGLLTSISKVGMKGRVQLDSFVISALQKVVAADPTQDVGYLVGALDDAGWTAAIAWAVANLKETNNRVAIEPPITGLTKARVEEAHEAGLRVVVYTVNSAATALAIADMGVDGIMTDSLNIAQVVRDGVL